MLFSILAGGDIKDIVIGLLLTLPIVLISLSAHEASHAFMAYKMGDRTAYNLGRMTFNPLKHVDPMGFLCMLAFGYGWAKPVPINTRNFKNPKYGMAFTAIAGPLANLFLGLLSAVFYSLVTFLNIRYAITIAEIQLLSNIMQMLRMFFFYSGIMNLMLMTFNLIPLPPFDGSRFATLFLPTKWYFKIMRYEKYSMIIILAISFACSRIFNFSPFSWVAEKLFYLVAQPVFTLFLNIFG